MAVRQPRYSKEEFAPRGNEIYESQVRQQVEKGNSSFHTLAFSDRAIDRFSRNHGSENNN